ncbi:hypothetical protein [Candidatus Halobonum tyrrellensis]|nr:hypothetical protein [Candidatus Halobonum tyrrellensis]
MSGSASDDPDPASLDAAVPETFETERPRFEPRSPAYVDMREC